VNVRIAHPLHILAGTLVALAMAGHHAEAAPTKHAASPDEPPLSLGYTNSGRLVGGKVFRDTPFMSRVQVHRKSKVSWALPNLLAVLSRAARTVARKFPGSVLDIGELSRKDGGRITSHLSHQSGRDADIGFYLTDLEGSPLRAPRFLRCDARGDGRDDPTIRFDDQRNWEFVRALLEDPNEEVRQIFIYAPLRARLLAYAAKVKAPRKLRAKAAAAMMQPVNALPHDDHFHVRISCPLDQLERGCADLPLWRAPGSPDEFGLELLAGEPRVRWGTPIRGVPLDMWGGMAKLWSVERAVCDPGTLTCGGSPSLICEDLGDPALLASFPRANFEPVAPPVGVGQAAIPQGIARVSAPAPATLPTDAFADEGPAVAAEVAAATGTGTGIDAPNNGGAALRIDPADLLGTAPARVAAVGGDLAGGMPSGTPLLLCPADAAAGSAVRAKSTSCSYDEPQWCECPVAALSPDTAGYGPAEPSVLE
jgi:penicillin-insensitive murein DD-endopeptidase